ncbi:MAG TPA: hypothetical protein VFZ68_04620 [Acidimicrobiales bacterium]
MRRGTAAVAVAVAVVWSFAAGCGDDDDDGAAAGDGGGEVNVLLSEWIVEPDPSSVGAGEVTFVVDNQGGEPHELVVVRADSADDLPVGDDDSFDEEGFGEGDVLGEVEDIAAGDTEELSLDLEPGNYVLLCNVVEEPGEMEMDPGTSLSHFANGMHASFTVE